MNIDTTSADAKRIRRRMHDNAMAFASRMTDEQVSYVQHFYPGEQQKMREAIKALNGLIQSLAGAD